jgi:hypothetical protein
VHVCVCVCVCVCVPPSHNSAQGQSLLAKCRKLDDENKELGRRLEKGGSALRSSWTPSHTRTHTYTHTL